MLKRECKNCGKEFIMNDIRKEFCSIKCYQSYYYKTVTKEKRAIARANRPQKPKLTEEERKERARKHQREYYSKHREYYIEYYKAYQKAKYGIDEEFTKKRIEAMKKYFKNRYHNDPKFREKYLAKQREKRHKKVE